jgi:hypothetical protein
VVDGEISTACRSDDFEASQRVGRPNNCDGVAIARQRHGPVREAPRLAGKIMNRDLKNMVRSPDQSWDGDVHVSPSELLSLLSSFHARLDAFFEEMRVFPEAASRGKTADSRSLTPEHDLPLVSAQSVPVVRRSSTGHEKVPVDRNAPTSWPSAEAEVVRSNRLTQRELAHASRRGHRPGVGEARNGPSLERHDSSASSDDVRLSASVPQIAPPRRHVDSKAAN